MRQMGIWPNWIVAFKEIIFEVLIPQTHVDVTARPGKLLIKLCHEGHSNSKLVGNVFEALFIDRVAVGHRQKVGIADIQLVLARSPFAFAELDRYATG